jgi:hypothetical protein
MEKYLEKLRQTSEETQARDHFSEKIYRVI